MRRGDGRFADPEVKTGRCRTCGSLRLEDDGPNPEEFEALPVREQEWNVWRWERFEKLSSNGSVP